MPSINRQSQELKDLACVLNFLDTEMLGAAHCIPYVAIGIILAQSALIFLAVLTGAAAIRIAACVALASRLSATWHTFLLAAVIKQPTTSKCN